MANDNFIPTYFLLGEEVCRMFFEYSDFNEFFKELTEEEPGFGLYKFTGNPIDLMYAAHEWGDYAVLTEEEYNKLAEL